MEKDTVQNYENEFFGQKSLTYKFLTPFFNRFLDLELVRDKITETKTQDHLTDQLNKFMIHNNEDWKKIKKTRII